VKPLTVRTSARVRRMATDYYGPFYAGVYQAQRDGFLIDAHNAYEHKDRCRYIRYARDAHRSFLRCLREAKREGRIS